MKTLPRIVKIISVEPFKITTLWTNGEIRANDFSLLIADKNSTLNRLSDADTFIKVEVSEERTLYWPHVMITVVLSNRTIKAPLDLDPDTLYSQSTLIKNRATDVVERIPIGAILRKARREAGLSQAQIATNSGTTRNYISRIENGQSDIQLETLHKIIALGLGKTMTVQIS